MDAVLDGPPHSKCLENAKNCGGRSARWSFSKLMMIFDSWIDSQHILMSLKPEWMLKGILSHLQNLVCNKMKGNRWQNSRPKNSSLWRQFYKRKTIIGGRQRSRRDEHWDGGRRWSRRKLGKYFKNWIAENADAVCRMIWVWRPRLIQRLAFSNKVRCYI